MMRRVLYYVVVLAFGFLAAPVWAQSYCQSSYGAGICPTCNGIGRIYTRVGGIYCTVCNSFCNISSKQASGAGGYTVVQAHGDPAFVLVVPKEVLYSLVQVNPDAAMLLAVLDARSKTVDALPPTRGDGGSDRAMSAAAVLEFIQGETDPARLRSLALELPASAAQSKVTWDLERFGASAMLRISHRFLGERDDVVSQPYRDLTVSLRWVPSSAGAGYWMAKDWKER